MANQPYNIARRRFVQASLDWANLDLRLTAWGGAPYFLPTDELISHIIARGGTTVLGTSQPITIKSVAMDGTAQTNGVVIPNVPVGPNVTHFTLNEANGNLILYIDEAIELPFVPNGLDMVVQPDWLSQRGWFRA